MPNTGANCPGCGALNLGRGTSLTATGISITRLHQRDNDALAILQFLEQAHDDEGLFDARHTAQKAAGNPQFLLGFRVDDLNLIAARTAELPLIVLDALDRGIERERTMP